MSISGIITQGFGSFGTVAMVVTEGFIAGDAPPAVVTESPDVGTGRVYYQNQRKQKYRKRLSENVRDWVDKLYADLTAPEMPAAVKQEAAKVVKPFAETKAKIPPAISVDWGAVAGEANQVKALLELWEREVERQIVAQRMEMELAAKAERHRLAMIEDEDAVLMSLL